MWGHKGCYKECQTLVQHGATRRSTVGSATCPAARSRRDGRRVDRRLSELLQHGGARLTNPNPNPNPDSDPDPDPDPNPNPNPSPNPTPNLQHGVDLLEGGVDLLAQLAARQHHLVRVGDRVRGRLRARVRSPCAAGGASRRAQVVPGGLSGLRWPKAGPAAGGLGGRRRAEAGQAAEAGGGGPRRAGPCSDRPCSLARDEDQ